MTDRTFRLETRDERGHIIRIDVRTVSTFDEFMAAAAALGAEVLPRHGHAAEPEQPDWDHQIVFSHNGTWMILCPVVRLAQEQLPPADARTWVGRFECAVNDLGDRFLIGDRVTDGSACCVSEPASDDTTMTTPTIPNRERTDPAEAACDTPKGSSDVTDMTTTSSVIAAPSRFAPAAGHPGGPDWVRLRTGSGRQYEGHRSATCPGDGVAGHQHDVRCVDQAEG